ncbi:MAG: hypothetical protein P8Z42_01175 [Anaerolineales bacterium]|jgi:hypothetical protein
MRKREEVFAAVEEGIVHNEYKGDRGLELIERYANGEALSDDECQSMRAVMYLISRYLQPPRLWADFRWRGPKYFVKELWPKIKERPELLNGQFGHGAVSP